MLGRVSIAGTSSDEIAPGASAFVRVRLESPAVLTRGDRFIIRAYSPPLTIGGGVVLDPAPKRPGIRTADGRASLERLRIAGDNGAGAVLAMTEAAGLAGFSRQELVQRAGLAASEIPVVLSLLDAQGVVLIADRLVATAHLDRAAKALLELIAASHKAHPMSDGLPREEAREKLFARAAPAVFEKVIDDLKSRKALLGAERLALPAHKPVVAGADDRVRTAIIDAYLAGGLKPPDSAAIETSVNAPRPIVEKVTTLLLREKILVKLDTIVFHGEVLRQLKEDVAALKGSAPAGRATVDVAAFKDRYGVSRKYAIPLLEFLDRERVTRRTGDVRLVL
jgi:selenocysteine-specific elongation factor